MNVSTDGFVRRKPPEWQWNTAGLAPVWATVMRARPFVVLPFYASAVAAARNAVTRTMLVASTTPGPNCIIRDTLVGDALWHGENTRLEVTGGGYFPQSGNDFKFDPTRVRGGVSFIAMVRADPFSGTVSGDRFIAASGRATTRDPGSGVAGTTTSVNQRYSLLLNSTGKIAIREPGGSNFGLTASIWSSTRPNDWIVAAASSQYNAAGNTQTARVFAYNLMTGQWSFETFAGNTNVVTGDGYFEIGTNSNLAAGGAGMDIAYAAYLGIPLQQEHMMQLLRDPWGPIRRMVTHRAVVETAVTRTATLTMPIARPTLHINAASRVIGALSLALPRPTLHIAGATVLNGSITMHLALVSVRMTTAFLTSRRMRARVDVSPSVRVGRISID